MSKVETMIAHARAQRGEPYRLGATGPDRWDCSSLVQASARAAGVALPRTAAEQYRAVAHIAAADARRGDLVFWGPGASRRAHHVGIVLDHAGGVMVVAPHTGAVVREQQIYRASDGPVYGRIPGLQEESMSASEADRVISVIRGEVLPRVHAAITGRRVGDNAGTRYVDTLKGETVPGTLQLGQQLDAIDRRLAALEARPVATAIPQGALTAADMEAITTALTARVEGAIEQAVAAALSRTHLEVGEPTP